MFKLNKLFIFGVLIAVLIVVGVVICVFWGQGDVRSWLGWDNTWNNLDTRVSHLNSQVSYLEDQVNFLRQENIELRAKVEEKPKEIIRREIIRDNSQEELLTVAVAKVAPAVVSIVATKDVPQMEIEYVNPFGDDPFFKDFNIRVPRYKQKGTTPQNVGSGTGFLFTAEGYIATNRHVVSDTEARYTVLLASGKQLPAQVIYRDTGADIAILKIEGAGYPTVILGDSLNLKLGQSVFAIGNALGEFSNTVSVGIISGIDRTLEATGPEGVQKISNVLQTDAAINPGNSGGPLVDLQGKVVGINVAAALGSENIGFSIPIDSVKRLIVKYQ